MSDQTIRSKQAQQLDDAKKSVLALMNHFWTDGERHDPTPEARVDALIKLAGAAALRSQSDDRKPEVSQRTLADYRPQHDEDCAMKGNGCKGQCGEMLDGINCLGREGHTGEHYGYGGTKRWTSSLCTCGLNSLLAALRVDPHLKRSGTEILTRENSLKNNGENFTQGSDSAALRVGLDEKDQEQDHARPLHPSVISHPDQAATTNEAVSVCRNPEDCCRELSRVWVALGVAGYTGKSASEHAAELRGALNGGVGLIAAERTRQQGKEGYSEAHDDTHTEFEMMRSAVAYALHAAGFTMAGDHWPFGSCEWKPSVGDPIRDLVKAGALIAAEIDRLRRLFATGSVSTQEHALELGAQRKDPTDKSPTNSPAAPRHAGAEEKTP